MAQDGVVDTMHSRSAWCTRPSPIIHTLAVFAPPYCGNWDKIVTHSVSCFFFLLTVVRLSISLLPTLCRTNCNILPWWNQQKGSRSPRSLLKSLKKGARELLGYTVLAACYIQVTEWLAWILINLLCLESFLGKMNTSYMQSQEFIVILISLNNLAKELSVQLWWY